MTWIVCFFFSSTLISWFDCNGWGMSHSYTCICTNLTTLQSSAQPGQFFFFFKRMCHIFMKGRESEVIYFGSVSLLTLPPLCPPIARSPWGYECGRCPNSPKYCVVLLLSHLCSTLRHSWPISQSTPPTIHCGFLQNSRKLTTFGGIPLPVPPPPKKKPFHVWIITLMHNL